MIVAKYIAGMTFLQARPGKKTKNLFFAVRG